MHRRVLVCRVMQGELTHFQCCMISCHSVVLSQISCMSRWFQARPAQTKMVWIIVCICARTHDTGCSFEVIFMKFTWLMRVHPWVNHIVFENNPPNRTTKIGENVPPKPVFRLSCSPYEIFWAKDLKTVFCTPFSTEKVILIFVVRRSYTSKNGHVPKNYFSGLFWKILFFRKNFLTIPNFLSNTIAPSLYLTKNQPFCNLNC